MNYPAFDPQSPLTPLQPEELDALDRLLQALPADGAMSLDGLDGYFSALAIGPAALLALPTADWLPLVWGGDAADADDSAPFATRRQRKNTVVLALRHLRHTGHVLRTAPDTWEPIFSVAEQGAQEWVDAREWCMGFLQAVDLLPEAWGPVAWTDPVLQPLVLLGGGLDGAVSGNGLDARAQETPKGLDTPDATGALEVLMDPADLQQVDRLSRAVPDAVLRLLALHAA